jgi:hypothetical protein
MPSFPKHARGYFGRPDNPKIGPVNNAGQDYAGIVLAGTVPSFRGAAKGKIAIEQKEEDPPAPIKLIA